MKNIYSKLHFLLLVALFSLIMTACSGGADKPQTNDRDSSQKQVEVINDYINIRAQASTNSEALGKVYKNEIYTVLETNQHWIKIQTSNNITGWIISTYDDAVYVKYLETNGSIPEEQTALDKIASGDYLDVEAIKYTSIEWISDVPLSEIKHIKHKDFMSIQPNMFITKNGELYEFTADKLYSNDQVTKKVDTNVAFDHFYIYANDRDLSMIIAEDNSQYSYNDSNLKPYDDPHTLGYELLQDMLKKHPLGYGVYKWGAINYYVYYYVSGNDVYYYRSEISHDSDSLILLNNEVLDSFPKDETVLSVEGQIFVTNKAFYKIGVTNQDDVNKYEDIEPIYGLIRIDKASDEYSKIAYFNGTYLIYKDDPNHLYIYRD